MTVQVCEENPSATAAPFGDWSASEPTCQSECQRMYAHRILYMSPYFQ